MRVERIGKDNRSHTDELTAKLNQALLLAMEGVRDDAKDKVGVDTGALKDSLSVYDNSIGDNIRVEVGSDLDYAFFHSLDNPYLEEAIDQNLESIKQTIKDSV